MGFEVVLETADQHLDDTGAAEQGVDYVRSHGLGGLQALEILLPPSGCGNHIAVTGSPPSIAYVMSTPVKGGVGGMTSYPAMRKASFGSASPSVLQSTKMALKGSIPSGVSRKAWRYPASLSMIYCGSGAGVG